MGIVSRILGGLGVVKAAVDPAKDRRLWASQPGGWAGFGRTSSAGKAVNLETTLQLSAAWACIKVTAQAVSSLPLQLFEKQANGDRVSVPADDDFAQLLDSPNADQTSLEYWESSVAWLLASGNCYSEIVEGGSRRRIVALQPLAASDMWPKRNSDGELEFHFRDRGHIEILPRSNVFHIK